MALTLVPEYAAKPGTAFTFNGPTDDEACRACPVRRLCFDNIQAGRRYRVHEVRDVQHPCGLHDDDRVRVVTVEEVDLVTTVERRRLRGTAVKWTPIPCGMPECASYSMCHPAGARPDASHEVIAQRGTLPCPAGFDLETVALRLRA